MVPLVSMGAENPFVYLFQRIMLQSSAGRERRLGGESTYFCMVTSGHHNRMPQTGDFSIRTFYFSRFWRLEVRGQDGNMVVPGEGSLPGLQTATSPLRPHVAETGTETRLEQMLGQ